MSWLLWQNVMVTLAKCHGYFGKMSWLLWQNVMVTLAKCHGYPPEKPWYDWAGGVSKKKVFKKRD